MGRGEERGVEGRWRPGRTRMKKVNQSDNRMFSKSTRTRKGNSIASAAYCTSHGRARVTRPTEENEKRRLFASNTLRTLNGGLLHLRGLGYISVPHHFPLLHAPPFHRRSHFAAIQSIDRLAPSSPSVSCPPSHPPPLLLCQGQMDIDGEGRGWGMSKHIDVPDQRSG